MPEVAKINRRLTTILAADIAGYARLMGADEAGTVDTLKGHQAILFPLVKAHGGRIIDTAGDGIFAEFSSVTEAVACAVEIQDLMIQRNEPVAPERRMLFRIGINFAEVIYDAERIYGDGINIASRLEGIAQPGGICVTAKVRAEVADKLELEFFDLGEQALKHIAHSVHVYAIRTGAWSSGSDARQGLLSGEQVVGARLNARPPAFRLLGRDADLDATKDLVGNVPLLTIVGTGGVGKTSLARGLLAALPAPRRAQVHWVDLAPMRPGEVLAPLVAKALGIELEVSAHAVDDLLIVLSRVEALIAIDNCEHVLPEVSALLTRALENDSPVCWLATSQAPLHLRGEVVYRLDTLDVPALGATLDQALRCGSIVLLRDRAASNDRRFQLDASNVRFAVDICRQLDGLPLAIEMAAARVATLGLQEVHEQLGHRLQLLTGRKEGPLRHHSLQTMFDWSYGLLSPTEQKVFRRLEPFVGGFSPAMAQQIARDAEPGIDAVDDWQALEAISALVDKSLVHRSADAPGRGFLLESARGYASRRLAQAGETDALRRRHAQVIVDTIGSAHTDGARFSDDQWIASYAPERHNVRAALGWACAAREPDLLARLVAGFAQIDTFCHRQAEVVQFYIPLEVLGDADISARAVAYIELSWAHYSDGSRKLGSELAQMALQDFEALGDSSGTYRALAQLTRLYESRPGMQPQADAAFARLRQLDTAGLPLRTRLMCSITAGTQRGRTMVRLKELEELASRSGFGALAAACRTHITDELLIEGRFGEAVEAAQRFLDDGEFRPRDRALILNNQALALVRIGKYLEATVASHAALQALPSSAHIVVDTLALAAVKQGRFTDAALMFGYGDNVRRERDKQSDPAEAAAITETAASLRDALGEDRLCELMSAGSSMKTSDALALAMMSTR